VEDYTATCVPDGASITGGTSPLTVTGLSNGTRYDCVVTARNAVGSGPVSVPSSVIPTAVASADLAVTMSNGSRFVTGGANNETGWSNARYDELIAATQSERDHEKRMALFVEAETILMDELPIIPFHFSVSKHLVRPHVQGFFNNTQDIHPLTLFSVPGPAGGKQ
jgi:ABC-type transport system substrate-binding protein